MKLETCTWVRRALVFTLFLLPFNVLAMSDKGSLLAEARQADQFSIFVEALEMVGMTGILEQAGPYTVFAPTNEAFEEMPQRKREVLFSDEHRAQLKKLLRYHIVPGRIPSSEMDQVGAVPALIQQLHINKQEDSLTVDAAHVVISGANVKNGVLTA